MKKVLLSGAALMLGVAASLTTSVFGLGEECDNFEVNGEASSVCQLSDIVSELETGTNTIKFLKDFEGNGVIVDGKNVTIDFDGHTFTTSGTLAGSTGTKNQAFQLLKGSTVTLKNGTVTSSSETAKFFIQNYADTILEDMILDATGTTVGYVVSNNNGSLTVKGDTNIIAKEGGVAFDMYYWPGGSYGSISVVFGEDYTGRVEGIVEYERDNTATHADDWQDLVELVIKNGNFDVDFGGKTEKANVAISGGTFTKNPSAYVVNGYYVEHTADGYIVKKNPTEIEGIDIEMEAADGEVLSDRMKEKMLAELKDTEVADINIAKVVEIELIDRASGEAIHETNEPLSFEIEVDFPELADGYVRNHYVVRFHEEGEDEISTNVQEVEYTDGKVVIESDLFSLFLIGYIDTEEPKAPKAPDTGANQTSGNSATASLAASAATGSVLALIALALKRKFTRH